MSGSKKQSVDALLIAPVVVAIMLILGLSQEAGRRNQEERTRAMHAETAPASIDEQAVHVGPGTLATGSRVSPQRPERQRIVRARPAQEAHERATEHLYS